MLYQINDVTYTVLGQSILSHIFFEIKGTERIAVVGENGSGKTTLLRLIAEEITPDRDDKRSGKAIIKARSLSIGMLSQQAFTGEDRTVEEEILSAIPTEELFEKERFGYETEYDRLFTGFGFQKEDKNKLLSKFSGGERMRIAFIRLLLQKPDILLLDEPTNHLDEKTVEWLEEYLKQYPKAVVCVSHDRFFLDEVAEITYELSGGTLKKYSGNYSAYRAAKKADFLRTKKKYEENQKERERLEELIRRFKNKPRKAAFARAKKEQLRRMEQLERPEEAAASMRGKIPAPANPGAKRVLEAEELKIGYKKDLLTVSLRVKRGQRLAVVGENGSGKSTFLKTLVGEIPKRGGKFFFGNGISYGYFGQDGCEKGEERTVLEYFYSHFPAMSEKDMRGVLANFLFRGQDCMKRVEDLSGGEKNRLRLAVLITEAPNLLILDEPTNHMDIPAKERLEEIFSAYEGTIIFVSHDRYFLSKTADSCLLFENAVSYYYPFGYAHYVQQRKKRLQAELMPGMILSEDQKLIDSMKEVPKNTRQFGHAPSDDAIYVEWRSDQSFEPAQVAEEEYKRLLGTAEALLLTEYSEGRIDGRESRAAFALAEEKCQEWTERLLAWYDVCLELYDED